MRSGPTRPCTEQVATTPSRTSAPTEVVWPTSSARSRPGSPRPVGSRGPPCSARTALQPARSSGISSPPTPPAPLACSLPSPLVRPLPPPGARPRLGPRRARAQLAATRPHSPSAFCVATDATAARRSDQMPAPQARSGNSGDPEPGGRGGHPHAGHAPRDRERTPERQEGPGGAPGGCPGYGACAEPSPSRALRVVGGDSGRLAGKTGEAL